MQIKLTGNKMIVKLLASVALLCTIGSAHAFDASQAYNDAVYKREVSYQCLNNKSTKVVYGFNRQQLPIYASANLNGKERFMPYNLDLSNNVDTVFGDENNFSLMSEDLRLATYHLRGANIQSPNGEILYKNCRVVGARKLAK